jgi:hypothetical protein
VIPQPAFPPVPGQLSETLFSQSSRYYGIEVLKISLPSGRAVSYVERRFLPPHESLEVIDHHTVIQGDRIDNVAAHYFGNPEMFYRLCDGNYELDPSALTSNASLTLNITLPARTVGRSDA